MYDDIKMYGSYEALTNCLNNVYKVISSQLFLRNDDMHPFFDMVELVIFGIQ